MRICFFADAGSVHTRRWVAWFARKHEVSVVSRRPWSGRLPPNVALYRLESRSEGSLGQLAADVFSVRKIMRRIRPEIAHGHYVLEGGLHAALSGVRPCVVTAWGSDLLVAPRERRISRAIARFVLGRADLITCDATHMIDAIRRLGPARARVARINFGTDTAQYGPHMRDRETRARMGAPSDEIIVISTRNLLPVYDVETLLRAAPSVLRRAAHVRFVIAGSGEQRESLEKLSAELGVSDRIRFAGSLSPDELARWLASSDIYVSTALSDGGLAASTAEAMASELPVVVTSFGANEEWVSSGDNGCVIPMKDPETLADAIVTLASDPEARRRFGKNNRLVIEERNSYDGEMSRMEALCLEMLATT